MLHTSSPVFVLHFFTFLTRLFEEGAEILGRLDEQGSYSNNKRENVEYLKSLVGGVVPKALLLEPRQAVLFECAHSEHLYPFDPIETIIAGMVAYVLRPSKIVQLEKRAQEACARRGEEENEERAEED
eukprot:PhM_4_TR7539/c0_g1_i2/m.28103